jgi:hypothetical protein
MYSDFKDVLDAFDVVSSEGNQYQIRCPAHEDRSPSMVATVTDDGKKMLLHCRAGCTNEEIIEAAGLEMRQLFAPENGTPQHRPKIKQVYGYSDENGDELFQVVRMEPKSFRQRHKVDGEWVWSMKGVRRVLFCLPLILDQPSWPVVICEGEKDCLRIIATGAKVVPTTNAGGAGKWQDDFAWFLAGRRVAIIPDTDDAGRKHAAQVVGSLIMHGVGSVRVVELPSDCSDSSDFLDKHSVEDFVQLMKSAPEWRSAT